MTEWVRCDSNEELTSNRHRAAKRIPNLRWHLLILIRKLLKRGTMLLDVDPSTFAETVFAGIEEFVSVPTDRNELQKLISGVGRQSHLHSRDCSIDSLTSIVSANSTVEQAVSEKPEDTNGTRALGLFQRLVLSRLPTRKRARKQSDTGTLLQGGAKVFITTLPMEQAKPRLTLVRLTEDHNFFDNTPARFAVFIFGPPTSGFNYRELGRCLCDMLSNPVFRRIIGRAKSPSALLSDVDHVLDHAIVIPPGQLNHVPELDTRRLRRALAIDSFEPQRKSNKVNIADLSQAHLHLHSYAPMQRTGKLFSGLISDIKRRYRLYSSDITDALHYKCLVSTILIFFITFATAIGLGEILRSKTEGLMGLSETLVSMCLCGVIWGLFSGQPLIIQTKTAAFVIIEGGLFSFCYAHNLNFMVVRVWTGVWVLPITVLLVAFEAPVLIRYVTRFTEETIDTLISVVLIFESLSFLIETISDNPLLEVKDYCDLSRLNSSAEDDSVNMDSQSLGGTSADAGSAATTFHTPVGVESGDLFTNSTNTTGFMEELHNQPNTALCTLLLMISTFFLSLYLERLKQSSYFSHTVRKAIGNFSIPITIPLMTLVANMLFKATYIHKLDMPTQFSPTRPSLRGWFVNPFDAALDSPFPLWAIFASIFPAFLLSILIFVELELAERELAVKERGLRKGSGFHLDLVLSGFLMFICGFFGIPWLGAGCVESFSHANALTIHKKLEFDDEPKVERVVEQRVTTILVALLQGASAFFGEYLRKIPVAVLMGIFVHLSITNLMLIQFVRRVVLYIVPRKYYPDKAYCQQVSMWRMHLYTTIQVLCFGALFGVEVVAKISIMFPMVVGIIALVRQSLFPRLFTSAELEALDSEGDLDDDEEVYAGTIRRKSINP